ncbi:MAG: cell division protein FtsZ [Synergistaceae bacterium]|nr:cell division protein FtsZ [Synergistaceae bacterium]
MDSVSEIFQLDKSNFPAREVIKVVGVGGAGNNALNHIIRGGVAGVEFIAANTDIAHLELSEASCRLILGKELTKGLGAGSDPEIGCKSAMESREDLRAVVDGADMVFIAAGMGGGTGTGAAPVIAAIAKEAGALVVAVVTLPFNFEGRRRIKQAASGIEQLRDKVDALIIIPNDRLLSVSDKKTSVNDAFRMADGVLHQAVQGVTDLIKRPGLVNVDFADVKTIMSNAGTAIMGIGEGYGEKRAATAAFNAINSPLMDCKMSGAKGILFNITGGASVGIHEINEAIGIITEAADEDAFIIWGHVFDPEMEDAIQITVIATGFDDNAKGEPQPAAAAAAPRQGQTAPRSKAVSNGVTTQGLDIAAVKNLNSYTAAKAAPRQAEAEKEEAHAVKKIETVTKVAPITPPQGTEEDLFKQSGAPVDQYDVPAFLRRRRPS